MATCSAVLPLMLPISTRRTERALDPPRFDATTKLMQEPAPGLPRPKEHQSASGKVIDADEILQRHLSRRQREFHITRKTQLLDPRDPVRASPAVHMVVPAVSLPRKCMGEENRTPRLGEGGKNVRQILFVHMLDELARPDEIDGLRGHERSVAEIVPNHGIWNHGIFQSPFAALDAQGIAADLVKESRRMPFAAADIEHGANAERLHGPGPQPGTPSPRIAPLNVATEMAVGVNGGFAHAPRL